MKKFLRIGFWMILITAFVVSVIQARDKDEDEDDHYGKFRNRKIRLLSVSDTPDPFSAKITQATFTGNFEVKRTDELGSKGKESRFRFFIKHLWGIVNSQTNQEVNRLVSEQDVIPPQDDKGYFPVLVTQSWNGQDSQGQLVVDGLYNYALTGELFREKLNGKDDKDKIKLIGISNSLSGMILVDNTPPEIFSSPAPDEIIDDKTPELIVTYADATSGVDLASLRIWFDDVEITERFTITESRAHYQIPEAEKLSDGSYTLKVSISDRAGNSALYTVTFRVVTAFETIQPEEGGTVEVTDPASPIFGASIGIPQSAITETTTMTIQVPVTVPLLPPEVTPVGPAVDFGPSDMGFIKLITIKVPYDENEVIKAHRSETAVKLYKFDPITGQWVNIPITFIDTDRNLVIAQVRILSIYQVVVFPITEARTEIISPVKVGQEIRAEITVYDSGNNIVTDYFGEAELDVTGNIIGPDILCVPINEGMGTSNYFAFGKVGDYNIIATIPELNLTDSKTVTVIPAEPAVFEKVSGDNQVGLVNTVLPLPFKTRVTDSYGNPISGQAVEYRVTSGTGRFRVGPGEDPPNTEPDALLNSWTNTEVSSGTSDNSPTNLTSPPELPESNDYRPFDATGRSFEHNGLKITSSEEVRINGLEIVTETNFVSFCIEPLNTMVAETTLTISYPGLANLARTRWQDGYAREDCTFDAQGQYQFVQDISQPHHIWFQSVGTGTIYVRGNPGETIYLKKYGVPIRQMVVVASDGITVDGSGTTILGYGSGNGIYLYRRRGVTITSCTVQNFRQGIRLTYSSHITLTNNITNLNRFSGFWIYRGSSNTLIGNTAKSNRYRGFSIYSNSTVLIDNVAELNSLYGLSIVDCFSNILDGNRATSAQEGIHIAWSSGNTLVNNTATGNGRGIFVNSHCENNRIYHNNIYNNSLEIYSERAIELSYFNPKTNQSEGNWWGRTTAPGFIAGVDSNRGNVIDRYPYLKKDGWTLWEITTRTVTTDAEGYATSGSFKLGPVGEVNLITASVPNTDLSVVFWATSTTQYVPPPELDPTCPTVTSDSTPTLFGTNTPNYTLNIYDQDGNLLATTTVDGYGNWRIENLLNKDGQPFPEGTHIFFIQIYDPVKDEYSECLKITITIYPTAEIVKISGDNQAGLINTVLPKSFVTRVVDCYGEPIPNLAVTYVVTEGTGGFFPDPPALLEVSLNSWANPEVSSGSSLPDGEAGLPDSEAAGDEPQTGSTDLTNPPEPKFKSYLSFDATGRTFEYKGLKITSSEEVRINGLEIVTETNFVSFCIEPLNSTATETTLIISYPGLANLARTRWQDGYAKEDCTFDAQGQYQFVQDISQPHHIWFQSVGTGTIYVTGSPGETIYLKKYGVPIRQMVVVASDGITVDGSGTAILGQGLNYGVYVYNHTNVTITNCSVQGFRHGIYVIHSSYCKIISNTTQSNTSMGIYLEGSWHNTVITNTSILNSSGIAVMHGSYYNTVSDNMACLNNYYGIIVAHNACFNKVTDNITNDNAYGLSVGNDANHNALINNTANKNEIGITLTRCSDNTLLGNTANNNNDFSGIIFSNADFNTATHNIVKSNLQKGIWLSRSSDNIVHSNTSTLNGYGLYFWISPDNRVFHNNIYDNTILNVWSERGIELSDEVFPGVRKGNWWGRTTEPGFIAGVDSNRSDVIDSHPYLEKDGWVLKEMTYTVTTDENGYAASLPFMLGRTSEINTVTATVAGNPEQCVTFTARSSMHYVPLPELDPFCRRVTNDQTPKLFGKVSSLYIGYDVNIYCEGELIATTKVKYHLRGKWSVELPWLEVGTYTFDIQLTKPEIDAYSPYYTVEMMIEMTPPKLTINRPVTDEIIASIANLIFDISYTNTTSGIYIDTLTIYLNNVLIQGIFDIGPDRATYSPKFDTAEEQAKFMLLYQNLKDKTVGPNRLFVLVWDKAWNRAEATRYFYLDLEAIKPKIPFIKVALRIIAGDEQEGLVGRCAETPLVVQAYNYFTEELLEGIPLSFEIIQGGGIFLEEPDYSTVTNAEGKAALHYHYGTTAGINKVSVGVLGDPSATPVEFTLEGYLPELEITPKTYELTAPSAFAETLKVTVTDPRKGNIGVKDVEVRFDDVTLDLWGEPPAEFLPSALMTDANGQGETGVIIPSYFPYKRTLRVYLPEFVDPDTGDPVFVELPVKVNYPRWLRIESGNGQIGKAKQKLENPLKVWVDKWEDDHYVPSLVTFTVKVGGGKVDGQDSVPRTTNPVDGTTSVQYTFGPTTEPQIIEAKYIDVETGGEEKVYFAAGTPVVYLVTENEFGEFVRIPSILTTNPFDITSNSHFQIEIKAPLNLTQPPSLALHSLNVCGLPASGISGAIGSLKIENISLTKVSENERYAVYRSDKRIIGTTKTLLPGEIITGDPAPGHDVIQMTNFGTLMPVVTFSPEGIKTLVRRSVLRQGERHHETYRRLIYPRKIEGKLTEIGLGVTGYKKWDRFEWDFNDGSPICVRDVGAIIHKFKLEEEAANRRKTFNVKLRVFFKDEKGNELDRKHDIKVRIALDTNQGTDLPPENQAGLETVEVWTNKLPLPVPYADKDFDIVPNGEGKDAEWTKAYGISLNQKRLAFTEHLGAYGVTMDDIKTYAIYGVYIDDSAWRWKREELEGIIEHEKAHLKTSADMKYDENSLFRKLIDFLKSDKSPFKAEHRLNKTKIVRVILDHAKIVLDDLLRDKFSFKYLSEGGWPEEFVRNYNWSYAVLVRGETWGAGYAVLGLPWYNFKITYPDEYKELKAMIKEELTKVYGRAIEEFPELEDTTEFDRPLKLIKPKEED